jgi:hypothetical protein
MIGYGKIRQLVLVFGLVAALALSSKGFAQDPILINAAPTDDFAVAVTFQNPIGNTVIKDTFSVNDVTFVATRTKTVSAGYTDTLVFSLTVTPGKQMLISYSGTVGNTAGTNVWTITGPGGAGTSATATSNQPAHDPKLGLLTEDYTASHVGAFRTGLIIAMLDQQFTGTINPMNAQGTLTYSTPTGIGGAFAGAFSSNKLGTQFHWDKSFSSPGAANNVLVDGGLFKKFDPRTVYGISEGIEQDSQVTKGNVSITAHDVSVAFVPEPSSLILGTFGFLGMSGAAAWRRWRKKVAVA